jgi:amidase
VLQEAGCVVEELEPDLSDADRCWEIIEMHEFMAACSDEVRRDAARLRPELVENVATGLGQSTAELAWAQTARTRIYRRVAALLLRYDFLIGPATPVVAPTLDQQWVRRIGDVELRRYFEWQRCACRITATAHPAMSVPAGFSREGLPVGMQVIARDHADHALLSFALAWEQLTGFAQRRPPELPG